jgi:nitrile hydratase
MNGIHDLGGMHGLGPIRPEPDEPVFHEDWERRMFGLFIAAFGGGHFNVDEFRHAIERMDPAHYLESSYYEHWLNAVETLLVEKGVLTQDELAARKAELAKEAA